MSTISSFLSATDASLVICTRGLTKTYKGVNALQNLDLQARCHSICGFLGPNGAGKSTTTCFIPNILGDLSQAGENISPDFVSVASWSREMGTVRYEHHSGSVRARRTP